MASKSIALFLVLVMATCSLQVLIIDVEAAAGQYLALSVPLALFFFTLETKYV